jgi:glycosyltransferase involved in cell wall biosynthesis
MYTFKDVLDKVDAWLVVVGKGDQTEARKLADSLGISENVIFSGFVDEKILQKYYLLCDVYACSSNLEGFGLTILEAMVAKKPVVATKVGAIPEIITNGFNGIIVEFGDIQGMSSAICTFLGDKNLATEIGELNWNYVNDKFGWNKCVDNLINSYNT